MKAFTNAKLVFPDRIEDGTVLVEDGKILASGNVLPPKQAEVIDLAGAYLGPGLVDNHCHGYIDPVHRENCRDMASDPEGAARGHLRAGTTSITPSAAYSWTKEAFLNMTRLCRKAIARGDSSIIGIHFEGPFTNPKYGARSENAWTYSREVCDEILDAAGEDLLHCTYAPELPNAPEFEQILRSRGIVMDIGHTELSPEDARRAVASGASVVTHLFDAMGCWRGRDSIAQTGVLQESADAVLLSMPGLMYELICDSRGVHVKPCNAALALRAAGEDNIILITDSADRMDYDPHDFPPEDPHSAMDLRFNERGQLSGSGLVLSAACRNFMRFTGADIRTAFKCASYNPARALRLDGRVGSILPGRDANLLVVNEAFEVQKVYFRGEPVE